MLLEDKSRIKARQFILHCTYALRWLVHRTKNNADIISGALSHAHPYVLRCIKQVYPNKYKVTQRATVSKSAVVRQIQWVTEQNQMCWLKYTWAYLPGQASPSSANWPKQAKALWHIVPEGSLMRSTASNTTNLITILLEICIAKSIP